MINIDENVIQPQQLIQYKKVYNYTLLIQMLIGVVLIIFSCQGIFLSDQISPLSFVYMGVLGVVTLINGLSIKLMNKMGILNQVD